MGVFWHDLRHGFRGLVRSPGFSAATLLTLTLGLGVNATLIAFFNALYLGPIPFTDPERIVYLWSAQREGGNRLEVSLGDFLDWQAQSSLLETLVAFKGRAVTIDGDLPERAQGLAVSPGFFSVLDARAALGRVLAPDPKGAPEVVLSHTLWQQRFDGEREIVGRTIYLDREPVTVVGVMPADFWFPSQRVKLWTRLRLEPEAVDRVIGSATVFGRIAPGASVAQVRSEMETIASRLEQAYPASHAGRSVNVVPVSWELLDPGARMALLLLGFATLSVLAVSCVNVSNLLLARALARQRELGIRVALGAGRLRLAGQQLTENLAVALVGGALALLMARWGAGVLLALFPRSTPAPAVLIDGRVVGFTLGLALFSILLFGLLPALRPLRSDLVVELREGGPSVGRSRRGRRLSRLMVLAQVALALALMIVVGVMIRTLTDLYRMDLGFRIDDVLTARLELPGEDSGRWVDSAQEALEHLGSTPGIRAAGAVSQLPFQGRPGSEAVVLEGVPAGGQRAMSLIVTPGYFQALGIPLVKGRVFTAEDSATSVPVALVNEALARRLFKSTEEPLEARVGLGGEDQNRWLTVVGVVGDVRQVHPAFAPSPQVYLPHAQHPVPGMAFVISTTGEPLGMAEAVRRELARLDKTGPVFELRGLNQLLRDLLAVPVAIVGLLGAFGALALALSAVGIYGVVSYSAGQRVPEIGVRIAMGATQRDVKWLVLKEGLVLALAGVLFGLVVAFGLSRLMASRFVGVEAGDPTPFVAVTLFLTAVALLASYLPARRAARAEPMETLRQG